MIEVSTSRKYDMEEKTVWIYKLNSSTNKVEKFSVKIPMFFIQNDNDNTQGYSKLNSKNPNLNLSNNTSETNKNQMNADYTRMQKEYTKFGEATDNKAAEDFVGTQDTWFDN